MSLFIAPCPFCGAEQLQTPPVYSYVTCQSCFADGPLHHSKNDFNHPAVTAWNRRAPLSPEATAKLVAQRLTQPQPTKESPT